MWNLQITGFQRTLGSIGRTKISYKYTNILNGTETIMSLSHKGTQVVGLTGSTGGAIKGAHREFLFTLYIKKCPAEV